MTALTASALLSKREIDATAVIWQFFSQHALKE
jgi:poly(3-hydroxybutyrate) depolymerase